MSANMADRLYNLLPVVHRMRDADLGYPLRGLLQVISEQVNVVEADIAQLYENWFIETCQDWVVPYIGDLVGYAPASSTGEPVDVKNRRALARERTVISRSEVANTVRFRRRKGTAAVLEELAEAVAGWPSRAIEFYRLLSYTQNINYLHLDRGLTLDVRNGFALQELGGGFEETAHTVDVRTPGARHLPSRYNVPSTGLFVWRLRNYSITGAPAFPLNENPHYFLFNTLGHNMPLYNRPQATTAHPPGDLNLPIPITRRGLKLRKALPPSTHEVSGVPFYYGEDKSFAIRVGDKLVPPESIVVANLRAWTFRPPKPGQVAVDPELGRMVFASPHPRRQSVWVSYNYAFSAEIGGGEYNRPLSQPASHSLYLVGRGESFTRINDALKQWEQDAPENAVIEITDSGVYAETFHLTLKPKQTLQLRAANRKRPVIKLSETFSIAGEAAEGAQASCWFTLDGIVVTGSSLQLQASIAGVNIRHSTLVPGWGVDCDCEPLYPGKPSLELDDAPDCVRIEHSIIGSIQVERDEVKEDPCRIYLSDSILDSTSVTEVAVGATEELCAYATLEILRCTVFGQLQAHAIQLAENSILMGRLLVCRRQQGCIRFCYVTPGSRTPRRYECQPDMVIRAATVQAQQDRLSAVDTEALVAGATLRVEPDFNSMRYGSPSYCQLADTCATEITRGADDQSEMGAFHDLYQPQRADSLRVRLDEYTPAGMNSGIIFAS
ncbi:MAG TPA: hypothetical protein VE783_10295 [Candidatus Limnocylindrales bacterium]|nr:hypothetical protein [Candidatus Limnocylindrales bacterium]